MRDVVWVTVATAVVVWTVWSLVRIAIDPAGRSAVVLVVEFATWAVSAGAIAVLAWRQTRWGRGQSPVATGRSSSDDQPDHDPT